MSKKKISRESVVTAIATMINLVLILNTVFFKITLREDIIDSCLVTGIPLIASVFTLFTLKGKCFNEKQRALLFLSYGFAGIVVFRWAIVLLLLA